MRLITVLNRCTTFKRFVFEGSHFDRHACCGWARSVTKKALNDGFSELEQEHLRKQEAAGVQEPTRWPRPDYRHLL